MRYEFYACYELPRSVEALIQYSKSLQHLYNQYRPHGALAGQTPASYLKEAEPKRPARLIRTYPGQGIDMIGDGNQQSRQLRTRFARRLP